MVYIGFPVYFEEAYRLFKPYLLTRGFNEDEARLSEKQFSEYLSKFTDLKLHWIDKGIWILGYNLETISRRFWNPLLSVEDTVIAILEAKKKFVEEIKKIHLDISEVEFAYMEDGEEKIQNPDPAVFLC